jgi:hypothetical protein
LKYQRKKIKLFEARKENPILISMILQLGSKINRKMSIFFACELGQSINIISWTSYSIDDPNFQSYATKYI